MTTTSAYIPSPQIGHNVSAAKQYLAQAFQLADSGVKAMPSTYDGTSNGFVAQAHLAESSARSANSALAALEAATLQAVAPHRDVDLPILNAATQQVRDGVALLTGFVAAAGKLDNPRVHSTYLRDFAKGAEALFSARVLLDRLGYGSGVFS